MLLIGIAGGKGEGKDTVAQIILDQFKGQAVRIAFADALKREVAEACGVSVQDINDNKDIFRPILQWWGTELRRQFTHDENYWIDRLDWQIIRHVEKLILVPDMRFPNEHDFITGLNGITIRVTRDIFRDKFSDHISETALNNHKFDFTLVNNGTLHQLRQQCEVVINAIKERI